MKNMKKLLTMLSALAIGGTTGLSVVGCKSTANTKSAEEQVVDQLIDYIKKESQKDRFIFKDLAEAQEKLETTFIEFLKEYENWKSEDESLGHFKFSLIEITKINEQEKQFDAKFTVEFFKDQEKSDKLDDEADFKKEEVTFSNLKFYYKSDDKVKEIADLNDSFKEKINATDSELNNHNFDNPKDKEENFITFYKDKLNKIFNDLVKNAKYHLTLDNLTIEDIKDAQANMIINYNIENESKESIIEEKMILGFSSERYLIISEINNFIDKYEEKIIADQQYKDEQKKWKKDAQDVEKAISDFLKKKMQEIFDKDKSWNERGYELKIEDNITIINDNDEKSNEFTARVSLIIQEENEAYIQVNRDLDLKLAYGKLN